MNKINDIFDALTDNDLRAIVLELHRKKETGELPDGTARKLILHLTDAFAMPFSVAFDLVQLEPVRRAALKWAESDFHAEEPASDKMEVPRT